MSNQSDDKTALSRPNAPVLPITFGNQAAYKGITKDSYTGCLAPVLKGEREAFEHWYVENYEHDEDTFLYNRQFGYLIRAVDERFNIFKAGRASSAAQIQEQPPTVPAEASGSNGPDAGLESEAEWEAQKARLREQYPDIAGDFKVFEVALVTEAGCDPSQGEFCTHVSRLINGWVSDDDYERIRDAIWEEIKNLNLPEEGITNLIVYESGEREDVFWSKFFRVAAPLQSADKGKP